MKIDNTKLCLRSSSAEEKMRLRSFSLTARSIALQPQVQVWCKTKNTLRKELVA